MSSLLNKLKGHGGDKHHTGTAPTESYNHPSSDTGYDNTNTSGYGDTTSPTHRIETGYGNSQNTSSGYDNGPLNSHSDGGRYHAPKGTAVGQGHTTQQGYGESGYGQSGYGNNQPGYGNTTQGPHSSNLANQVDPRVDSDNSRANQGYGTTTTTTTNTSTSVGHDQYGTTYGDTHDANKRLPADPNHPTLLEKANPKVDTDASRTQAEYSNTGYGNSAGSNQYPSTYDSNKRLPEDPNHPTLTEKANPNVLTDSSRRQEQGGYGTAGYGNTTGSDQYAQDSNKHLPKDPNHPTMMEKLNPKVDTDSSRRNEYDNTGYGNTSSTTAGPHSSNLANRADPRIDSDMDSRRHGHNDQYAAGAAGAAGAYGATESSRHHAHPVRNDDNTMMNRSHPHTSMHPSDKRYDSSRIDQQTGPDGEYLPGPAPNTAGPHKSDMLNKLDPRVDSDQSKLEKERERETYGTDSHHHGTTYGNEHERRINEGHHERRHEGTGTGTGIGHHDQYGSNAPLSNRDSGYGGQGSNVSTLPHRKPVNETGTYGNDQYGRGGSNDYDRSGQAGAGASTYNNNNNNAATTTTGQGVQGNTSAFGDDENDFECAKCGHKNTHLRKNRNKTDQYGNPKPSLMEKLNPKVDSSGDGQAGFMK